METEKSKSRGPFKTKYKWTDVPLKIASYVIRQPVPKSSLPPLGNHVTRAELGWVDEGRRKRKPSELPAGEMSGLGKLFGKGETCVSLPPLFAAWVWIWYCPVIPGANGELGATKRSGRGGRMK